MLNKVYITYEIYMSVPFTKIGMDNRGLLEIKVYDFLL